MKAKITLTDIKSSDGWMELAYDLKFKQYMKDNPDLSEDDASDKFYDEVITPNFKYGEFADLEIEFDENFNIVGGKLL